MSTHYRINPIKLFETLLSAKYAIKLKNLEMTKEEFKNKRIELGLTQAKLGNILGVSDEQISNIERGKRKAGKSLIKLFETLLK